MLLHKQGGSLTLKKIVPEHLTSVLHKLEETGCTLDIKKDSVVLEAPKRLNGVEIKTMPYPRFSNRYAISFCKYASHFKRNIYNSRKYI